MKIENDKTYVLLKENLIEKILNPNITNYEKWYLNKISLALEEYDKRR
jgi:hypothetical protein